MTLQLKLASQSPQVPDLAVLADRCPVVIGRSQSSDVPVPDAMVSRRHCLVDYRDAEILIRDLESTNGTLINGQPIEGEFRLSIGDLILLGGTEFEVQFEDSSETVFYNDAASVDGSPV